MRMTGKKSSYLCPVPKGASAKATQPYSGYGVKGVSGGGGNYGTKGVGGGSKGNYGTGK